MSQENEMDLTWETNRMSSAHTMEHKLNVNQCTTE